VGYGWFMWLLELAGFMTESLRTHPAFSYTVSMQFGSSTVYVYSCGYPGFLGAACCSVRKPKPSGTGPPHSLRLHRRIDFKKK